MNLIRLKPEVLAQVAAAPDGRVLVCDLDGNPQFYIRVRPVEPDEADEPHVVTVDPPRE